MSAGAVEQGARFAYNVWKEACPIADGAAPLPEFDDMPATMRTAWCAAFLRVSARELRPGLGAILNTIRKRVAR